MPTPFDPDAVLAKPLMAVLGTISPDGPRTAPVWILHEEGAVFIPSDESASSAKRIAEDPRVSVEITDFDNEAGVLLHLGLRGTATVEPFDIPRFKRLLAKYLGPDEGAWNPWFIDTIARMDDPTGRMIRVVPESIFTNNVSFFRTGPEYAWP